MHWGRPLWKALSGGCGRGGIGECEGGRVGGVDRVRQRTVERGGGGGEVGEEGPGPVRLINY